MQENYLAKWLNGDLTEAEFSEFKKTDAYASYQRIINASKKMNGPEFNADDALIAFNNRRTLKDTKVVELNPFKKFMKVAAAVLLLVAGSYFYMSTLDEKIVTQYAENSEIVLPDNSEVILNADSQLSYSKNKWNEQRNVNLKGEAFFKVAKGKRFTVATNLGKVTVLGTQFNVENRDNFFEVTCFEGLVSVTFNGKETKLSAGNSFIVINGKITTTNKTKDTKPSWVNAESTFESIPFKYVLDEFERQHNIIVETSQIDTNQLYTGSFSNTNTELALKSICVPSKIKFKLEDNKVLFYAENEE